MRELTFNETKEVNGGMVFLAAFLFTDVAITAGGVATAAAIGGFVGLIGGGIAATFRD